METKIGYKVVRVEGDKLVSTWAEYMFKKEYKVGEWTEGVHELLPLVLFDDEDAAFRWFNMGAYYKCFKCEYVPSKQNTLTVAHVTSKYDRIQSAVDEQKVKDILVNTYPYVILAKAIKLIEEVTR